MTTLASAAFISASAVAVASAADFCPTRLRRPSVAPTPGRSPAAAVRAVGAAAADRPTDRPTAVTRRKFDPMCEIRPDAENSIRRVKFDPTRTKVLVWTDSLSNPVISENI